MTAAEAEALRTEMAGLRAELAEVRADVAAFRADSDEVRRSEELHRELLRLAAGVDPAETAPVRHLRAV